MGSRVGLDVCGKNLPKPAVESLNIQPVANLFHEQLVIVRE